MEEKIKELELEILGLKFMNELLMDKLDVDTEEIKAFGLKCLDNFEESEKNTDSYYFLMGMAYQEEVAEMILKNGKERNL